MRRRRATPKRKASRPPYGTAPDLRAKFVAVSKKMTAEFERTVATGHRGARGALRETAVRDFLETHLPTRFGVGTGELVHPANLCSKQCDVVVYDRLNTPRLMPDEQHSLFPMEAVLAVVQVKSRLSATDLRDAFDNLRSAFRVANDPSPYGPSGQWVGERTYGPS